MALEFISRILSIYKADTTQHRQAVKELSGDQKKAAVEELKRIEASNAGVESQIKKIGKLAVVVGSVGIAAKIAFDSIEFAGKRADLAATANIESMEGLRKATRGLMTDTELLTAGAKIQQGQFKLTQKEMESVTGAMAALAERGNDAAAVTDAFTKALIEGKTEGLKKFGVAIYEGGNRVETHNAILSKAAELAGDFSKSTLDGADKMSQAKVTFSNATDSLRESIGKTAESLTPMVSGLADVVRLLAETGTAGPLAIGLLGAAITGNPAIGALLAFGAAGGFADVSEAMFNPKAYAAKLRGATAGGTMQGAAALSAAQRLQIETTNLVPGLEMDAGSVGVISLPDMAKDAARFKAMLEERRKLSNAYAKRITDEFLEQNGESYLPGWADGGQQRGAGMAGLDLSSAQDGGAMGGMEDFLKRTREDLEQIEFMRSAEGPTVFERMFGKREEIDGFAESFGALSSIAGSAYGAMVDGTMGLGQAVKKSAADAIKSIGLKMLLEGAYETAMGIKMLAGVYTAGLAPGHFAAAGKFFAGAALAGVAANALGGGGGGGGSGARPSAPSSYGTPASGAYQGGQNVTIVYGDQFADDSPRNRRRTAQRLVGKALGTSGGTYS